MDESLLSWITFLPLAAGVALLALSALARRAGRRLGPAGVRLARGGAREHAASPSCSRCSSSSTSIPPRTGYQFVEHAAWIPDYGIHYFVGIDGISLVLVVLTTFLMPIVLLASWNDIARSVRSYVFFMLFLETGMLGAFVSLNLFQFYVFWELMLVPMYFIIGIWGGPRRVYAAVKFFLFTMFGSLLMLVAILVVYYLFSEQTGQLNFDLVAPPGSTAPALLDTRDPADRRSRLVEDAVLAVRRLRARLRDQGADGAAAHLAARTRTSRRRRRARWCWPACCSRWGPTASCASRCRSSRSAAVEWTPVMLALALIGIVYGSLVAMVQDDIKKLVAYSSVAHLGFVMLGIFALNVQGLDGGVLQMVNHGLSTGALFLLVGMLYERRHTRRIADFGGVAQADAGLRRLLRHRHDVEHRAAAAERLRRRVPDPARHLPRASRGRGGRDLAAWCWPPSTCSGCTGA